MIEVLISGAILAAHQNSPSLMPAELSLWSNITWDAAKFVEESSCFGVPHETARSTLQRSFGARLQSQRGSLVRKHGEALVAKSEDLITFGAECKPEKPPGFYRSELLKNMDELDQRIEKKKL